MAVAEPKMEKLAVTVNNGLIVEELVEAGSYGTVNSNITSQNFTTARTGEHQLEAVLVHFDRTISSEDALAELDWLGLRAGELHELLALGAQHPDKQKKFPVVALGSEQDPYGDRYVPYLDDWDGKRGLDLYGFDDDWDENDRFLAFFRK